MNIKLNVKIMNYVKIRCQNGGTNARLTIYVPIVICYLELGRIRV